MSEVTTPRYGIHDLKQKRYLPASYESMFRDQGMAEANFEEFQVDITTLRPSSHPLHEAQKYHFAMITYLTSADSALKRYCQAALNLTEAEWDECAGQSVSNSTGDDTIAHFNTAQMALFLCLQ